MSVMNRLLVANIFVPLMAIGALWAQDQSYPTRPVYMTVPFEAGGPNDVLGRILCSKAGEDLGQTIVIENRTGAGGSVGTDAVARATPDGYRLLFSGTSSLSIN